MEHLAYLTLLDSLACLWLGLFVLAKNWRQAANRLFCLTLTVLALMELARFLVVRAPAEEGALFFIRLAESAAALLPGSLFVFTCIANRADWREHLRRRWLPAAFFVAGSLAFAPLAFDGRFVSGQDFWADSPVFLLGPLGQYFHVFFLIACAAALINLEGLLRSTSGVRRWQVKYGVLGLGGITVGFVFVLSQNLIYHVVRVTYIPVLSAAILLSLLPLAYGVVRGRFLEVEVFISRYVIYNSLAVMTLGAYLVAMGLLVRLMGYLGLEYRFFWQFFLIFASGMALAVVLLSSDVRTRVKHFINRHFYKNKYDYRLQWLELSQRLGARPSREELAEAVVDMLGETVFVREISLWLCDEEGAAFGLQAGRGVGEIKESVAARSGVLAWLATQGRTVRAAEIEEEVPLAYGEHLALFEQGLRAVLITPLMAGKRLLGFISVGPESTGRDFVEDDLDLLDSVAAQAAGALLGTYLSASLVKAQEEQVFHRLASFVIHDLKNFTSMLSLVVQNAERHIADPEFQKDALATVRDTVVKMKALAGRLSEARQQVFELRPAPTRLDELAREAVANLAADGVHVELAAAGPLEANVDREQVGKVLTNLLLNAAEAGAKRVRFTAGLENGWAVLSVADDGAGMERDFLERRLFRPFATTKKKGLGIGLYQSKMIVEAHGGRLEAESEAGRGTTFTLRLPAGPA